MVVFYFSVHGDVQAVVVTIILLLIWKVVFSRRHTSFSIRFVLVISSFFSFNLSLWDCLFHCEETTQFHFERISGSFLVTCFLWMIHGFKRRVRKDGAVKSTSLSHYIQMAYLITSMFLKPMNINGVQFIFELLT